jgi:hypothetical protein
VVEDPMVISSSVHALIFEKSISLTLSKIV